MIFIPIKLKPDPRSHGLNNNAHAKLSVGTSRYLIIALAAIVSLDSSYGARIRVNRRDVPACKHFSEGLHKIDYSKRAESAQPFDTTKWQMMQIKLTDTNETAEFEGTKFDINNDGVSETVLRMLWTEHNGEYDELYVLLEGTQKNGGMLIVKNLREITDNGKAVKRGATPLFVDQLGINAVFFGLVSFDNKNYVLLQDDPFVEQSIHTFALATYSGKPDIAYSPKWDNDAPSIKLDVVCILPFADDVKMSRPKLKVSNE